jgi:hypothetical protein
LEELFYKLAFPPVGLDRGNASKSFAEVGVNGRPHDAFKTLQLMVDAMIRQTLNG